MLRGLTTAVYPVADHAAAVAWYTELTGVEPYFSRPGYTEFRLGDYSHELGLIDSAVLGQIGHRHHGISSLGRQTHCAPSKISRFSGSLC